MIRNNIRWIAGGLVCLFLLIYACTDDDSEEPELPPQPSQETATTTEIRNFLKGKELYVPNIGQSFPSATRVTINGPKSTDKLKPVWHTLREETIHRTSQYSFQHIDDVRTIFLTCEDPIVGYIHTQSNAKKKELINSATFRLVVFKIKGELIGRIVAYIPDNKFTNDASNNLLEIGFDVNHTNYSGLQLVFTMDGDFLYGDKYDKGENLYHFLPTSVYKQHFHESDSLKPSIIKKERISFRLIPFRNFATTRAAVYNTEENGDGNELICSLCGRNANECDCISVIAPPPPIIVRCPICNMEIQYCLCCSRCHFHPCICCYSCGQYPCTCCKECGLPEYLCKCCKRCNKYPCICPPEGGGGGGGGGSSPTNPGDNTILPNKSIACDAKYIPPYIKGKSNCLTICNNILQKMLGNHTEGGRYQLYKQEKNGDLTLVGNAETAFGIMNTQLNAGKPLIIGVDYRIDSPNSDGTDHFMIVNGRGYDTIKKQYYFTYIETGRTEKGKHEAVSDKNKLYYDKNKGTFSGPKYWAGKTPIPIYTITQIRTIK